MIFKIFTAAVVLSIFIACLVEVSTGGDAWFGIVLILIFTIVGWLILLSSEYD